VANYTFVKKLYYVNIYKIRSWFKNTAKHKNKISIHWTSVNEEVH